MKKFISLMMLIFVASQFNTVVLAESSNSDNLAFAPEQNNVEVYYFHYSRRCATCEAVEKETQKALEENFADLTKGGKITFLAINIEEGTNQSILEKFDISGQTLIFVSGDKTIDITNDAFMYARTKPDKFKKKVKKTVEGLLN